MAGRREDDEVTRDVEAAAASIMKLRPTHRIVSMWGELRACLENIRKVEFYLGYLPEKPNTLGIDHEAVQVQLQDARMLLGQLALRLSDEAEDES